VGLTTANARALGLPGGAPVIDAHLNLNSDFAFDSDPADGISAGQFDFMGVVTHELGHILGFVSSVDDLDQLGGLLPDSAFSSSLLDLFRFSSDSVTAGLGYSDFTADNRSKYFSVDGGQSVVAPFATGVIHGDGQSTGHWQDGLGIGLMDPTVASGELLTISEADMRAIDVLGYTLIPEPTGSSLLLVGMGLLLGRRWRS